MTDHDKTIVEENIEGQPPKKNDVSQPGEPQPDDKKTELTLETVEPQDTGKAETVIEDKNPYETGVFKAIKMAPNKKVNIVFLTLIGLLVIAILAVAYFLFIKGPSKTQLSDHIRQQQELAQKVQGYEESVKEKQDEIFQLAEDVKEKTGEEGVEVNLLNLNDQQKDALQKRIDNEEDVSVKSLLEDILEKNKEISELQARIAEIEEMLPKPHIVKEGENHYQIAMDFLINEKNIDKEQAIKLVERTALLDTMVPGFKVWNFYAEDEYGTSVTQGTAPISPNTLIRRAKKKLVDARDQAISERDKLSEDIKTLEEKRAKIITQLDMLSKEKENLIVKVGELDQHNQVMQQTVNSVYYLMDTQRNLKKKKILKGGFLKSTKLKDVSPELFTMSVDLREGQQIAVSAVQLGISKIRDISVYPKFYKEGKDYSITIAPEKQTGAVLLLEHSKFKNERIVIAVK